MTRWETETKWEQEWIGNSLIIGTPKARKAWLSNFVRQNAQAGWGGLFILETLEDYDQLAHDLVVGGHPYPQPMLLGSTAQQGLVEFTDVATGRLWYVLQEHVTITTSPQGVSSAEFTHWPLEFVGWTPYQDSLVRTLYTKDKGDRYAVADEAGNLIIQPLPQNLVYQTQYSYPVGEYYNLFDKDTPAAELAERFMAVMDSRRKGTRDDNYWDECAKRLMTHLLLLGRGISSKKMTLPALLDAARSKSSLDEWLALLTAKLQMMGEEVINADPSERKQLEEQRKELTEVEHYFTEDWYKTEAKNRQIISAVLGNAFGQFAIDPNLKAAFCSPGQFNLTATMHGRVVVLLTGGLTTARPAIQFIKRRFLEQATHASAADCPQLLVMPDAAAYMVSLPGDKYGDEAMLIQSQECNLTQIWGVAQESSIRSMSKYPEEFLGCFHNKIHATFHKSAALPNADRTSRRHMDRYLYDHAYLRPKGLQLEESWQFTTLRTPLPPLTWRQLGLKLLVLRHLPDGSVTAGPAIYAAILGCILGLFVFMNLHH